MMRATSGLMNEAIEQVVELSADAHIQRRMTVKSSPQFHKLTGAIAAYGKTLAVLTELQQREEFFALIGEGGIPACLQPVC